MSAADARALVERLAVGPSATALHEATTCPDCGTPLEGHGSVYGGIELVCVNDRCENVVIVRLPIGRGLHWGGAS
jgi:hypothetical protein